MFMVRAIKPATPFKSSVFREEVVAEANRIKDGILKDFEKTTATWKDQPEFKATVKTGSSVGGVQIEVKTDDEVYNYVDKGTKAHIILPKKKGALAFRSRYKAKTKPRVIGSYAGGSSGKQVVARVVHHPGTKARQFTKTIYNKWKVEFQREMKNALARATRRSGHGTK